MLQGGVGWGCGQPCLVEGRAGELEIDDPQGPFRTKPFYDSIGVILERKDKKMGYHSVSDTTRKQPQKCPRVVRSYRNCIISTAA